MKKLLLSIILLHALGACSSSDEEKKDLKKPTISSVGITANPIECQVYNKGETIPFQYVFQDDTELGNYNIEIHNDFDHHTHSTEASDCPLDEKKNPVNPWVYNKDYGIPSGKRTYTASVDIPIPDNIDAGDYHFMIRVTDAAGWQELKSVSIKIIEQP